MSTQILTTTTFTLDKVWIEWHFDDDFDSSYLEEEGFEDQLKSYQAGEWQPLGCIAKAYVTVTCKELPQGICTRVYTYKTTELICSPGLWGIESNSDKRYLNEVAQDEVNQLAKELEGSFPNMDLSLCNDPGEYLN